MVIVGQMTDVVQRLLTLEEIRDMTIFSNIVTALIIGPWMAFAVTPDAGFRCRMALLRLVHRVVLVIFSIVLMYNGAMLLSLPDRVPLGSALMLNLMIMVCTLVSAFRHLQAPPIPENASWRSPMVIRSAVLTRVD